MKKIVLAALLFAVAASAADKPKAPAAQNSMQRAIAWERHKDQAAARQARIEARHPTVTYGNADRSADRSAPDPGEPAVQQNKINKDKEK